MTVMPLTLNVGVSKKIGLPEYCSVGATCNLEVELESGLLDNLAGFHERVRDAYIACHQAVEDELARLQGQAAMPVPVSAVSTNGHGHHNGSTPHANGARARTGGERDRVTKPATPGQVKAIYAIARTQQIDVESLVRDDYGVKRPEELSLAQASRLIDQLKAADGD
jgi:hypothetical protein